MNTTTTTTKAKRLTKAQRAQAQRDADAALIQTVTLPTKEQVDAEAAACAAEEAANLAKEQADLAAEVKVKELSAATFSMRNLRVRLKAGHYAKAANGQPSCGDQVADALGVLKPEQVIEACMVALGISTNPYAHLNIGQQSMNLRNKLRGALKRGDFGFGVVVEAIEQITEEVEAAKTNEKADEAALAKEAA